MQCLIHLFITLQHLISIGFHLSGSPTKTGQLDSAQRVATPVHSAWYQMHWLADKQQLLILPFKKRLFLFTISRIFFSLRKWDLPIIQTEYIILAIVGMFEGLGFFLQMLVSPRKLSNAFKKVIIIYYFIVTNFCRVHLSVEPEQIWD